MRRRTDICARNPKVDVAQLFKGTTVMSHLLLIGFPFLAPVLLPVYFMFGTTAFKVSFVAANLAITMVYQGTALRFYQPPADFAGVFGELENESDRDTGACIAAVAIAFQQLMVVTILWAVSTLSFAWTVLAIVAWR